MTVFIMRLFFILIALAPSDIFCKKKPLYYQCEDSEIKFLIKFRPEMFFGKNTNLLNDNNPDKLFFFRHTIDIVSEYNYGKMSYDHPLVTVKWNVRNKGIWGDPESIAVTTETPISVADTAFAGHKHSIPRHILWYRELWIEMCLSELLGLNFCNRHTLTLGAFPFLLGRGIALGDAYAVDPDILGYFSPYAVDQFAFGLRLAGEFIHNCLGYDLYGAILDNKADTFDNVNLKILGQQFGRRFCPARGTGIVNYVVAGRLKYYPIKDDVNDVYFEPYGLFNSNPEQKIEFLGDASIKLVTLGFASESYLGNWEFGFDTAFNIGAQFVKGWDRNIVTPVKNKDTAVLQFVNTQVTDATTGKDALATDANQALIITSPENADQNGMQIGSSSLVNKVTRFTNPYKNKLKGSMFVCDLAYNFYVPNNIKLAAGFGYASGDNDPNRDLDGLNDSDVDGDFEGFIGLQEIYSGMRIKSAFFLNGQGRIPRLLSFPTQEQQIFNPFASKTSRFTNIIYTGASVQFNSCDDSPRPWQAWPNIMFFWQEHASRIFDVVQGQSIGRSARSFFGTEINLFSEIELMPDLKFYAISAVFFPGSYYKDVKGKPLTKDQQKYLNSFSEDGVPGEVEFVPTLGNNMAFFFNLGFEYRY
ncbi:hypothetical protein M1446_05190 [Candidatus Dependentiae bacterium]|nr:hypothetical protein [Candidatus Dependentiae bacterium]